MSMNQPSTLAESPHQTQVSGIDPQNSQILVPVSAVDAHFKEINQLNLEKMQEKEKQLN
jgi:hypothetical protein